MSENWGTRGKDLNLFLFLWAQSQVNASSGCYREGYTQGNNRENGQRRVPPVSPDTGTDGGDFHRAWAEGKLPGD